MYCNNCGHEVKDSDSFCSNCGARIFRPTPAADPAAVSSAKQPASQSGTSYYRPPASQTGSASSQASGTQGGAAPARPQQKKGGFWKSALIIAVVYLLFRGIGYLFGSSMAGGTASTSKPVTSSIPTVSVSFTPVNFGIATFTIEHDGSNDNMTLYYRDDIVYMISETVTTPLETVTDTMKDRLREYENEQKAKYDKYSFIDFSMSLIGSTVFEYYTYNHIDQPENIAGLYELGMTDSRDELISMAETRTNLLSSGWKEK